jgi:hypothetical protein
MNTQTFLQTLESLPDSALVFDYGDGQIQPGYHVTEIMAASYSSMDCGGQANHWQETIIQLMGPTVQDKPDYMTVNKFLSIYRRVAASVPVNREATVRFEYGDARLPAIHYHVGEVASQDGRVTVHLQVPGVTCKASDRKIAAVACCAPAADVARKAVWGDSVRSSCCG